MSPDLRTTESWTGLHEKDAALLLSQYGENVMRLNESKRLLWILRDIVKEPMFVLLVIACLLYFVLGEIPEGFMMMAALLFVSAISLYQEVKSAGALAALQSLTEPRVNVIRDGVQKEILIQHVVPGDLVVLNEGEKVPADARLLESHDLSVNEAVLTGESFPVEKDTVVHNRIFQGTVVNGGRCIAKVLATGSFTELGKLGKSITTYTTSRTALQQQIDRFVRWLALFGFLAFLLIFFVNFFRTADFVLSLLFGLTLAMSAIPEEIPVAFSSFMSLGAQALSRSGIITRLPQVVENLGAVNVICLDKTGTITANRMAVHLVYDFSSRQLLKMTDHPDAAGDVLYHAFLASEPVPFDAMEKAIFNACADLNATGFRTEMVKEYPLEGHPPMMTHVYNNGNGSLAAAKGGVERVVKVCRLTGAEQEQVLQTAQALAASGQRVLGVARAVFPGIEFPAAQDDFDWQFLGLVSLTDPPKPYIHEVLSSFYRAGITVKLLTGDHQQTAISIADEVGLQKGGRMYTGEEVTSATESELLVMVQQSNLFTRMFPAAKLKVIRALQQSGSIVAMTGDGVNDGPALKAADIGIALGKEGTEVARQSADLILTDDDLHKITEAIRQGRKIFSNLKKAVRYIISIHIPIIVVASVPLLLGWRYPNIFTPIHVIFLELIMGPTCSIFFEREPAEPNSMQLPPRGKEVGLFDRKEMLISILQGLVISFGVLALFGWRAMQGASLAEVRTVVFTTFILSNLLLTFVNRSFEQSFFVTFRYPNNLVLPVVLASVFFLASLHFFPVVQRLFGLAPIPLPQFFVSLFTALVSVGWIEVYKAILAPKQAKTG